MIRPLLCALILTAPLPSARAEDNDLDFFRNRVYPLLTTKCFQCHGESSSPKGGLTLTSREAILRGGDLGPAVNLNGESHTILDAIRYVDLEMPPSGQLSEKEQQVIEEWIRRGIPFAPELEAKGDKEKHESTRQPPWSFRPIARPPVPPVSRKDWPRNSIDRFILKRLEDEALLPLEEALKKTFIKRVYYNLTGLPPSPAELEDALTLSHETIVARLLQSHAYGEKWGQHWLDLVRYAETNGFERDQEKPFAWRYRDYVIRSFNRDKPFNQFIIEQVAGDELSGPSFESHVATGFLRLGAVDHAYADQARGEMDELDDIVRTTSEAFLGLTVGCARCHDHKLEPISQLDYYRYLAFFRGVTPYFHRPPKPELPLIWRKRKWILGGAFGFSVLILAGSFPLRRRSRWLRLTTWTLAVIVPTIASAGYACGEFVFLEKTRSLVERKIDGKTALCVAEYSTPPTTHLLIRGNPKLPKNEVSPSVPENLRDHVDLLPIEATDKSSGRRLAFAKWVASPKNPLTARVVVNRIWQHHFGEGIVASSNNFGASGQQPSYPDLLDWLASELIENAWSIKHIQKLIVLSSTFRMKSKSVIDRNRIAAMPIRRLSAEEIRDSILMMTGNLNSKSSGPSIRAALPAESLDSQWGKPWKPSPASEQGVRSVYLFHKRSLPIPFLQSFDKPELDSSCAVRFSTTHPAQALATLNGEFIQAQSRAFAIKLQYEGDRPLAQIERAFSIVLCREPTDDEISESMSLIEFLKKDGMTEVAALSQFCTMLFNLNEFLFLD